jgi:Transcriptional regulatory protein, C terminal
VAARVLRHDDEEFHLTPIEFKLLRVLLRHRGRPLAHESLLAQVWGAAHVDDTQTLRVHIANLRRKVGRSACYLRTDHRFRAPASGGATVAPAPPRPYGVRQVSGSRHDAMEPKARSDRSVGARDWRAARAPYG